MAKQTPAVPQETRPGGKPAACPVCDADVSTATSYGGLVTCPNCARTLVLEKGSARLATAADTVSLPESMRVALRKSRPETWKQERAARVKAIRGRK
jgi:hypothetical protein